MSTDEYVPRAATWDEIETGFHEYAADLTRQEMEWGDEGPTSFPPEFADWKVGMAAARKWLAAHDARVRRDAAREALDGLYEDASQDYRIGLQGDDKERMNAAEAVLRATYAWMDHYPEETP